MSRNDSKLSRRIFLKTTAAAAAGAATLPTSTRAAARSFFLPLNQTAKYTRYNVMSDGGRRALASYAKGIEAMLKLPATNPQNWFRNSFIHLMDCPHGNWWFYVWHRGYIGFFEETIRNLSGDSSFALPYWDWTTLPEIPQSMFDGVLTPTDKAFEPSTKNLAVFTAFIQPALTSYWNSLNSAQRAQLNIRGYTSFDLLWYDVTGFNPKQPNPGGVSGNMAYAITCGSRYLSRDNPKLDPKTAYDVSPFVILSGLKPIDFYNPNISLSFTSAKTPSHNSPPGQNSFSVLEGLPHNKVHNYIGGVGPLDPGPYGNMTNFLSPVDPIFFLHHSNMDRLWDVWTRKQQRLGLPYLPPEPDLTTLSKEPFLFYVNGNGQYVGQSTAGEYLSTARFNYDYEPGFPDGFGPSVSERRLQIRGVVQNNTAALTVPSDAVKEHLAAQSGASLIAAVTIPHPAATSPVREFDVIVNAPADVTAVNADSPYYAGTIAFFGNMAHAHGEPADASFAVPLPKAPQAFPGLEATNVPVNIRIVPAQGHGQRVVTVLKSATIRSL